jgi:hypothetical protein
VLWWPGAAPNSKPVAEPGLRVDLIGFPRSPDGVLRANAHHRVWPTCATQCVLALASSVRVRRGWPGWLCCR